MPLLSRRHLWFLIVDEVIGSSIVNLVLNGALAFYGFRGATSVPLWGLSSIAVDTWATAFLLPLVTAFFANVLVRAQVTLKVLPPLAALHLSSSRVSERPWMQRGALLGLLAVGLVATPTVGVLALCHVSQLTPRGFIWFKAIFAAALGAVATPLLGWWSLQDASRAARGTAVLLAGGAPSDGRG